jgi:hypothetical protein
MCVGDRSIPPPRALVHPSRSSVSRDSSTRNSITLRSNGDSIARHLTSIGNYRSEFRAFDGLPSAIRSPHRPPPRPPHPPRHRTADRPGCCLSVFWHSLTRSRLKSKFKCSTAKEGSDSRDLNIFVAAWVLLCSWWGDLTIEMRFSDDVDSANVFVM